MLSMSDSCEAVTLFNKLSNDLNIYAIGLHNIFFIFKIIYYL